MTAHDKSMEYIEGMERIASSVEEEVIREMNDYDYESFTKSDVLKALSKDRLTSTDFGALLSPSAEPYLELLARRAQMETRKKFGNSVQLFTPLYIANYCENLCLYCGFNCRNKISRAKLTVEELHREMEAISKTGLGEILILTGESRTMSDLSYIGEACKIASQYFHTIGLEVYPMNTDEYCYLHECGADYVTVFQETYDVEKYGEMHLSGHKCVFPYRINAQERALMGGMRGVAFGALLGLSDFRKDAFATGMHAFLLQKKYPHAELSISCPRLRPIKNQKHIQINTVSERQLFQVICAYRIFLPFAGVTISTRERQGFRDNVIGLAATKLSAGVQTGIGGHEGEEKGDAQFVISDGRTVTEVREAIMEKGCQPVFRDYVRLSYGDLCNE
jgi:2-iminoacetate synthase